MHGKRSPGQIDNEVERIDWLSGAAENCRLEQLQRDVDQPEQTGHNPDIGLARTGDRQNALHGQIGNVLKNLVAHSGHSLDVVAPAEESIRLLVVQQQVKRPLNRGRGVEDTPEHTVVGNCGRQALEIARQCRSSSSQ